MQTCVLGKLKECDLPAREVCVYKFVHIYLYMLSCSNAVEWYAAYIKGYTGYVFMVVPRRLTFTDEN